MIQLGVKARDKITGLEGVVVTRVQHITGCDRYALQPGLDKDGKVRESEFFDEMRLEVLDQPAVNIDRPSGMAPG